MALLAIELHCYLGVSIQGQLAAVLQGNVLRRAGTVAVGQSLTRAPDVAVGQLPGAAEQAEQHQGFQRLAATAPLAEGQALVAGLRLQPGHPAA
ncbi:hypothetical protein D3C77_724990 [compost metagenome]